LGVAASSLVIHVASTENRIAYKILIAYLKGRDHSEDLGVGGRILLEWILEK
jgi:hypothetical protein